jgi:hypothetical protein
MAKKQKPVLESDIVKAIKDRVALLPETRIKKMWSTGINRDIDLLVVSCGLAGFYEIKRPGKYPTGWQSDRLKYWVESGADTAWFDNVEGCVDRIKALYDKGRRIQELLADAA